MLFLDFDQDGEISKAEFLHWNGSDEGVDHDPEVVLHGLFDFFNSSNNVDDEGNKFITPSDFRRGLDALKVGIPPEEVQILLGQLDSDYSGRIEFEEFEDFLKEFD